MKMHKMNEPMKILALTSLWLSFFLSTMEKTMLTDFAKYFELYEWKAVWMLGMIIICVRKIKRLKASFISGEGIPAQKRHPRPKNHLKVEQLLRNESTFITMSTSRRMEWATISQGCHEVKKEMGPGIISREEIIRFLHYGLHEARVKMDEDSHVGETAGSDSLKCSMKNKEALGAC